MTTTSPGGVILKEFLDHWVELVNRPGFIPEDPVAIPHKFSKKQDIEIAGFFAAILAWGRRQTILNKCDELLGLMDRDPHNFVLHHSTSDLKRLEGFVHRTFRDTDLLYFIEFLRYHYGRFDSLEDAFMVPEQANRDPVEAGLIQFHEYFFSLEFAPSRTRKHIANPGKGSSCKRLNMFLRWMCRKDTGGVDFGLWQKLDPAWLYQPLDVHVERVGRALGLLNRKQRDWRAVKELTQQLRVLDPEDPIKYDFALFGIGLTGRDPIELFSAFSGSNVEE